MSQALSLVRPEVGVRRVEPEALGPALAECDGACVVFCSRITHEVEERALSWVEMYPSGESLSTVSVLGVRDVVENLRLEDLVSVIDRTGNSLAALNHAEP